MIRAVPRSVRNVLIGAVLILTATSNHAIVPERPHEPGLQAEQPAKGMFLVASRGLRDPNFSRTVVLLLSYDKRGTLGLIINRRSHLQLSKAFPELHLKGQGHRYVYFGGPVLLNRAVYLVRVNKPRENIRHVLGDVYFGSDRRVLEKLIRQGPAKRSLRFYLGHAGWRAGQLEAELRRGDWYLISGRVKQIFSDHPRDLWYRLIKQAHPRGLVVRR